MAVSFNGVLVSREAGSLMPSMNLDKVKITDTVMNAIKLDSGANKLTKDDTGEHSTPINSDKNNLPIIHNGAWSLETEFYANFNGYMIFYEYPIIHSSDLMLLSIIRLLVTDHVDK